MAVKSRDEILEALRTKLGDQTDDDTITILEDVTDTFSDLETKAKGDGTDWKQKYEESEESWRKKYTERFYSSDPNEGKPEGNSDEPEPVAPKSFSDLFKTE